MGVNDVKRAYPTMEDVTVVKGPVYLYRLSKTSYRLTRTEGYVCQDKDKNGRRKNE